MTGLCIEIKCTWVINLKNPLFANAQFQLFQQNSCQPLSIDGWHAEKHLHDFVINLWCLKNERKRFQYAEDKYWQQKKWQTQWNLLFALTLPFILFKMLCNQIQVLVHFVNCQRAYLGRPICHYLKHNVAIVRRIPLQIGQFARSFRFWMHGQGFHEQSTKCWDLNAKWTTLSIFMRHKKSKKRVKTGILKTKATNKIVSFNVMCMLEYNVTNLPRPVRIHHEISVANR